ncbi:hypothetical protein QJS10_CPA05g00614 [Acorus calamus]|uniref:Uncharacterized protein n=1 Tax=Acorus calamus TaxID=4465 RepID=A0AAV9EUT3_ACOCL|nr:hypothetical protein QJS10_CPA05g00614 [Acorus calamus]
MSGLILLRGPRRFLYRQTVGRFQSEQAMFDRAEKKVSELGQSVAVAKKEDAKLLERASFAEQDMQNGFQRLIKSGSEIRKLANSVYKIERQAEDLMAGLRQVPGREAIKLRSEVASMADTAKQQRITLQKRILKISELGVSV